MVSSLGLRSIELFAGLAEARLEAIARALRLAQRRRRHAGSLARGARPRRVFHRLGKGAGHDLFGRRPPGDLPRLRAGEFFGEVAALDDMPRSADVVALESSLLASMPASEFRRLLREELALAERVLRRLASLVRRLSERVIDISTLGVHHRIHSELLRLAREAGVRSNSARIDPAPKHAELASQVSTYREEVTRELSALAKAGLVEKDGHALVVRDVERLSRMVEEVRLSA